MRQLEAQAFRPALRLARKKIVVYLEGGKRASEVWSNYDMARGIERPVQRLPKVGHFSTTKAQRGVR